MLRNSSSSPLLQCINGWHIRRLTEADTLALLAIAFVPALFYAFAVELLVSALANVCCVLWQHAQLPLYTDSANSRSSLVIVLVLHPLCSWMVDQVQAASCVEFVHLYNHPLA